MGGAIAACPLDLWVYQEIVHEVAPELIISTTASARYLAGICQLTGSGDVAWIGDGPAADAGGQSRLRTMVAPPLSAQAVAAAQDLASSKRSVLVVLDGGQGSQLALDDLRSYGALVTPGSYLIVEGTSPRSAWESGTATNLNDFLAQEPSFVVDRSREKFYLSSNQGGYLRKVGARRPMLG